MDWGLAGFPAESKRLGGLFVMSILRRRADSVTFAIRPSYDIVVCSKLLL